MIDNNKQDNKARNKNIYMMLIIIILFTIGILIRWNYVTSEIKESINKYINP